MPNACFCYTTNIGYLGPTLLSAAQARRHLAPETADVVILYLGPKDATAAGFAALCARYGVRFQRFSAGAIDGLVIQFARHYLDRLLDPAYRTVIHVDGDTQIAGPLDPLFEAYLPSGAVLATPDPMAVMIHDAHPFWRRRRAYLRSIGIPEARLDRYFNTGIFRLDRSDLGAVGRECVRLCQVNGARYRYSEQDAFNVAFGADAEMMSFRWNFPAFFFNSGLQTGIRPRLIHFMSNPRPWQGAFMPWGRPAHRIYGDFVRANPELAALLKPMSGWPAWRYAVQQHVKRLLERHSWSRPAVLARVAAFEAAALV